MSFRTSSVISAVAHAAVLGWCLVTFSGKPLDAAPQSIPVDVITAEQFSQITKGVENARKADVPSPLVEKKAEEQKPAPEPAPKVTEKKEVKATAAAEPTPQPPEKPPEKTQEKKVDAIAEALKKEEKKPPPKKPVAEQPKFDANKVAALLDKRAPQRQAAVGEELNQNPSLGRANGAAARLTQNEIDALRQRISQCWTVPVGADSAQNLSVVFRVQFKRDGSIQRGPDIVEASASAFGPAFAESGKRAILQCQPYTMLRQDSYDQWRDIEIKFTPSDMFRG